MVFHLTYQAQEKPHKKTQYETADIYEEATGIKLQRNFNCKSCVFNLYKNAGILFRQSELYYKQENMRKAREKKNNKIKDNKNV